MGNVPEETAELRSVIEAFIGERLKAKLEQLNDDANSKAATLKEQYDRETWLENAAKRVGQIRLATHALKYSHPDARGSSVYYASHHPLPEPLVSSAGETLTDDVVGNAAALDVFKFLKLETGGRTILQRAATDDAALKAAFCDDEQRARNWCEAFTAVTQSDSAPSTHALAKQLYFPMGDGSYHLLAPLYPTSLAHRLYIQIQHDRFSDEAKAAREAKRNGKPHATGYREYPNLASRSFGGRKPQNISQLNSERGGAGYLLSSCPPRWDRQSVQPPAKVTTIFSRWLNRFYHIRERIKQLKAYLEGLPTERTNRHMRDARERFVKDIVDEVLDLGESVRRLPPGWSGDPGCKLDPIEACWLDSGRAATDETFSKQCQTTDWPTEISHRFGNWLNAGIRSDKLPVGDPEHGEWMRVLEEELDWLRRTLRDE